MLLKIQERLHCFFQAEDGIRDLTVTGVQTCALPILEALMRPVLETVFQSLIIVSYCIPGSAEAHAASAIQFIISRALTVSNVFPVTRAVKFQSASASTACINSSVTRTELLA